MRREPAHSVSSQGLQSGKSQSQGHTQPLTFWFMWPVLGWDSDLSRRRKKESHSLA